MMTSVEERMAGSSSITSLTVSVCCMYHKEGFRHRCTIVREGFNIYIQGDAYVPACTPHRSGTGACRSSSISVGRTGT
jgi:hypothetical protein